MREMSMSSSLTPASSKRITRSSPLANMSALGIQAVAWVRRCSSCPEGCSGPYIPYSRIRFHSLMLSTNPRNGSRLWLIPPPLLVGVRGVSVRHSNVPEPPGWWVHDLLHLPDLNLAIVGHRLLQLSAFLTVVGLEGLVQAVAHGDHKYPERCGGQDRPVGEPAERVGAATAGKQQGHRQRRHYHPPGELDTRLRVQDAAGGHAAEHDGAGVRAGDEEDEDQKQGQDRGEQRAR